MAEDILGLTPFTLLDAALDEAEYECIKNGQPIFIVQSNKIVRGERAMFVVSEEDAADYPEVIHVARPAAVMRKNTPHLIDGIPLAVWCRANKTPVTYRHILARIRTGMDIREAVTAPAGTKLQGVLR